jgi:aldehyde dehydrogenase (NAD+)
MARAASQVRYHAELADKTLGDTIPIDGAALTFTTYEPYGVVGVILPYNAPLAMFFGKVSAALAAGNAVVVKPAEQAACSTLAAAALFGELDIPPGLVNIVAGEGAAAGQALAAHPDVAMLHFTGSTATGRRIVRQAAGNLKKVSLELGGKSPNIVFADADLDGAADGVAAGIYTGGAGQSCLAGSRILVERRVFANFADRLRHRAEALHLGDPLDLSTDMGPVTFRAQYDKVRSFLEPEHIVFGGRTAEQLFAAGSELRDGFYVEPTLLSASAHRAIREEIFGPVAVAIPFEDENEAIEIANDTQYGLAAGVWTESVRRAHRMSRALHAGTVWVNTYRRMHWQMPFGGHKESGNGPAYGAEALREWLNLKAVWIETAP